MTPLGWDQEPEVESHAPLSDDAPMDLLDALVEERAGHRHLAGMSCRCGSMITGTVG